jgi:hypothetical protein
MTVFAHLVRAPAAEMDTLRSRRLDLLRALLARRGAYPPG